MARVAVVLSLTPLGIACGSAGTAAGNDGQKPTCELASKIELADENEVAPNGQTGSKILAAVPESLHTSLHWDFSSSGLEVEVPGSIGLSTGLDLTFSFPSEPEFFFEDRIVVDPAGDVELDIAVICEDYVTTSLDVSVVTEDGTIAVELTGLTVRLGPDRPETDYVAKPSLYESAAMATWRSTSSSPKRSRRAGTRPSPWRSTACPSRAP